jgi:long-subunit fatty acid transport protein
MRLTEELDIRGSGINAKLGIIYLVSESIRLGVAAHSPTRINLSDTWRYGMVTIFQDGFSSGYNSPEGQFRYRINTPWRVIGSAAIVAKQHGFLSVDYEYVDYRQSKLSTYRRSQANYGFQAENEAIKNVYRATANIRIGGEFNPHKQISVRGGFALYGSPFFDGSGATQIVSGGIGYKWTIFYANLGLSHLIRQEKYYLYDAKYALPTAMDMGRTQVSISLGVRWTKE